MPVGIQGAFRVGGTPLVHLPPASLVPLPDRAPAGWGLVCPQLHTLETEQGTLTHRKLHPEHLTKQRPGDKGVSTDVNIHLKNVCVKQGYLLLKVTFKSQN